MDENYSKHRIVSNLIWKMMERIGTQGVQLLIQVILARLLFPEDFGVVAIVMVFISLAQVFVQSGFKTALVQKKDSDEFASQEALNLGLFDYVNWYNNIRIHGSLGYQTPAEYKKNREIHSAS